MDTQHLSKQQLKKPHKKGARPNALLPLNFIKHYYRIKTSFYFDTRWVYNQNVV